LPILLLRNKQLFLFTLPTGTVITIIIVTAAKMHRRLLLYPPVTTFNRLLLLYHQWTLQMDSIYGLYVISIVFLPWCPESTLV
jgi:hypothetical protein